MRTTTPHPLPGRQLLCLALALGGAMVLTELLGALPLARAILPGLWLAAGALLATWRWPHPLSKLDAGAAGARGLWLGVLALALAAALVALALWIPADASPRAGDALSPWGARLALLLLVPLAEELYFRGALLSLLVTTLDRGTAAMLSAALFALIHLPQGTLVALVMLVLGLLLAALALVGQSVIWAILGHLFWNGLALVHSSPRGEHWLWLVIAATPLCVVGAWAILTAARRRRAG